jgi:hypothetical protein
MAGRELTSPGSETPASTGIGLRSLQKSCGPLTKTTRLLQNDAPFAPARRLDEHRVMFGGRDLQEGAWLDTTVA